MPSYLPVTALSRGLDVLRVVNSLGEATVADIHKQTGLHRATVVRMLETLEHEGYVARRSGTARFMVRGRVLQLSNGYRAHERVAQLAEPILSDMRARLGWPSDIAIPDGDAMLIALTSRTANHMMLNRRLGTRAPMMASSLGRAYLANCPDAERAEILDRLKKSPDAFDKAASDAKAVDAIVRATRKQGYAVPDEAYSRAMYQSVTSGFAVPVLAGDAVVGSVNLIFLTSTINQKDAVANLLPSLRKAAAKLGAVIAADAQQRA